MDEILNLASIDPLGVLVALVGDSETFSFVLLGALDLEELKLPLGS